MSQLYESIFILRPTLADEDVQKALDKVRATAEKIGATVQRLENWGKRSWPMRSNRKKKAFTSNCSSPATEPRSLKWSACSDSTTAS